MGTTHRHAFDREVCPTCGLYYLNCNICHPIPRCPDCFEQNRTKNLPWSSPVFLTMPSIDSQPMNYTTDPSNPLPSPIVFHVEPPAPEYYRYAIDQDGILILLDPRGRSHAPPAGTYRVHME